MSLGRERGHSSLQQSNLSGGNDRTEIARFPEPNTRYLSQDNIRLYHPCPEVNPLNALPSQGFGFNEHSGVEDRLDGPLAGLDINDKDSFPDIKICDSIHGRANDIGMDANQLQWVPTTVDPRLTNQFDYDRAFGVHTILTSSQPANDAGPSAWLNSGCWSERSSANLLHPTYPLNRSSAATYSQNSDSAWETDCSHSADDYDLRPMPDDNSASKQDYNDPQTGIWAGGNTYEQGTTDSTTRDMSHDSRMNSTMTQSIPQKLQQFNADVDAVTHCATQYSSYGDPPSVNVGLSIGGRPQTAPHFLTSPSASEVQGTQIFYSSMDDQSGISIEIDSTTSLGASPVQGPIHSPGGDQSPYSNIAPWIAPDNLHLSATHRHSIIHMHPERPASAGRPSADGSDVVVCEHSGCEAKFTGTTWKDSQRRHELNYHSDKPKPNCPLCPQPFQSGRPDNLKRHMKKKHPGHPLPAWLHVRTPSSAPNRRRLRKCQKTSR